MTTRFLSLFLAVAVLCSCMAVTVGATENPSGFEMINLLDYDFPNNGTEPNVTANSTGIATAAFDLPYSVSLRYVDIFVGSSAPISKVEYIVGTKSTTLTVEKISGYAWRIYGFVDGETSVATFKFTCATAGNIIRFQSVHASTTWNAQYYSASTFILEDQSVTQSSGSSLVTLQVNLEEDLYGPFLDWTSSVRNSEWQKYDYMTFTLSYYSSTVNNISVQIDGVPVPFTMNYIENPPSFDGTIADSSLAQAVSIYSVTVTVDLTGVNRVQTADLIVTVQGMGTFVYGSLHKVCCFLSGDMPDPEITWFQKIWKGMQDGFKSVVDAITGDTDAAEDFQEDVSNKTDELGEIGSAMDSVETPDEYNPNVSGMENMGEFMAGGGLAYVIGSPYILPLFTASMALCFASYALFGKKG